MPTVGNPILTVPEQDLHLGDVWASTSFHSKLHIKNATDRKVEIVQFETFCACTSVSPKSLTILPRQIGEVMLTIDLVVDPERQTRRPFSVSIFPIVHNSEGPPIVWPVTGSANQLLNWSPAICRFGDNLIRGPPVQPIVIRVKSQRPLALLAAKCDTAWATVESKQLRETEFVVSVRPNSTLPVGQFNFDFSLCPTLLPNNSCPEAESSVTVLGRVGEEVDVVPHEIHLGSAPIGQQLLGDAEIVSMIDKPFSVDSVTPSSPTTSVGMDNSRSNRIKMNIEQRVSEPGNQRVTIAIKVTSDSGRSFDVALPVAYYGLAN